MTQTFKRVRTRYAPSPTGFLHIGGARTALFCYLYAKKMNGDFLVRIEDTDLNRNIAEGERSQLKNLSWLGIEPDETTTKPNPKYAPYRQSERNEIYQKYLKILLEKDLAYYSYDNDEEIKQQKIEQKENGFFSFRYNRNWLKISVKEKEKRKANKEFSIRLKVPKNIVYSWKDIVRGEIKINSDEISEFVIFKSNNIPTYNFANVIDDHLMEISHVFRGEEHISNTPRQLILYKIFNWTPPSFGHLTIITNSEGKKLSKRDVNLSQFIEQYKDKKYIPEAIFNFLALLGWTSKDSQEIMTKNELIKKFDLSRLSNSPTTFDNKKLEWMANKYFKKLSIDDLRENTVSFISDKISTYSKEWIDLLLTTFQPQMISGDEIVKLSEMFFVDITLTKEQNQYLKNHETVVATFTKELFAIEWTINNIKTTIKTTQNITSAKGKNLFMPIRVLVTGQEHGPDLATTIFLLGKTKIKERLQPWVK